MGFGIPTGYPMGRAGPKRGVARAPGLDSWQGEKLVNITYLVGKARSCTDNKVGLSQGLTEVSTCHGSNLTHTLRNPTRGGKRCHLVV